MGDIVGNIESDEGVAVNDSDGNEEGSNSVLLFICILRLRICVSFLIKNFGF